ncbi:MAG: CHAT domain-containing protein, partial [Candidatus Binatia bacterium]
MNYHDLAILIRERSRGEYLVEARSPVRGEVQETMILDPASQELKGHVKRLEGGITDESFLKEFGSFLFDALFHGEVRDLFHESLAQASSVDGRGLRIKLDLQPPEIVFLPWEFLYYKGRDYFLAASPLTALTRYISLHEPIRQLETSLPIRVLVVIPAASGLDTEKEKQILQEAFSRLSPAVDIKTLEGKVTTAILSDALMQENYHILHFIGHGLFVGEEGYLFLNNEQGEADAVSASRVGQFFLGYSSLKLVVLNVCQGAMVSAAAPLVGLAPQVVRRGIPAVVAMRYPIPDNMAILFAREFYRKLCIGRERGRVDTAICHARNRMWMEFPGKRHVGTPVLFLRSAEGIIFDIRANGQDSHTLRTIDNAHRRNLALLEEQQTEGVDTPEVRVEIGATREAIKQVQKTLRWRNVSVVAVALLAFFASWVGLFNILGFDEHMERFLMRVGNSLSPPPWDDSLVVVAADPKSKSILNLTEPSDLRAYHAEVLPKLA